MPIFTHVCVGASDVQKSAKFYDAALGALGLSKLADHGDQAVVYGQKVPEFMVMKPRDGQDSSHANGGTIGFRAETRAAVDAFHAAGIANGGTDEGAPGPRVFIPHAYGAYMRDPFGNKIAAFSFVPE